MRGRRALIRIGIGACLATVSPGVVAEASASTFTTSCTGQAANVLGDQLGVSNPQVSPCVQDSSSGPGVAVPLPSILGGPHMLPPGFAVGSYGSSTSIGATAGGGMVDSASAGVGGLLLQTAALQIVADGAFSEADASVGSCPSATQTSGSSFLTGLAIDGIAYTGTQSQTIDVPGVATIYLNQQTISNGTITQRALDVHLAGQSQDIVVAASTAGVVCS